ncbi:hypothetical protein F383_03757 [Gossypium arboreum]|uniref:Uncharacterized protein n=1 Tax=Gossypium arboreum TaxID=29729 RepID=A0A0B0P1A6_GOSAR|nr:hypothetical protein F383_03757 [Gossypium arboreum]
MPCHILNLACFVPF